MIKIYIAVKEEARNFANYAMRDREDFHSATDKLYNAIMDKLEEIGRNNEQTLINLLYGSGSKPIAWIANEYGITQ